MAEIWLVGERNTKNHTLELRYSLEVTRVVFCLDGRLVVGLKTHLWSLATDNRP